MEREAVRIDVIVPFLAIPLSLEEVENRRARVIGEIPFISYIPLKDTLDDALTNWLKLINAKLDYIINLLTHDREGFTNLPQQKINLSEKGVRFTSNAPLQPGNFVEIKMVLDLYQSFGFYLYGKVLRCEKRDNFYEIAVEFLPLPSDIKEKLSFYILQKQRELIREMKGL